MFEANFSNSILDTTKIQPRKNLDIRDEDFLRCSRRGTDALLLLSACDVIFLKVLPPRLGPKHRLKAAICLAESFPCHRITLPARNIRKDWVKRTLNMFDSLPAPKHMILLGHDTSQHSPTFTRSSYNLGKKQSSSHNFMQVEVHTQHWMFSCDSI